MEKELVSIIVPVYNVEKYIDICIESILKQKYQKIELILVDDGSTDGSGEICKKYELKDSRVKYVYQENAGAAAARNKGLDLCSGTYIGFVDSDDYIDKDMYEILLDNMKENMADVGQILSRRFLNDGTILNQKLIEQTEGLPLEFYDSNKAIERYLLGNHSLCSHLYAAYLFEDVRIPEGMSGEDLAVIIPLYKNAKKVVKISRYMYNYRFNLRSVTNHSLDSRKLRLYDEYKRQYFYYNNNFYRDILMLCMGKTLAGILNAIILSKEEKIRNLEKMYKQELLKVIKEFEHNKYISRKQMLKFKLYLRCRYLYVIALRIKRIYYRRPMYGEE